MSTGDVLFWVILALVFALEVHTLLVNRRTRRRLREYRHLEELRERHRTISWHNVTDKPGWVQFPNGKEW